jgi:hypothetical protein
MFPRWCLWNSDHLMQNIIMHLIYLVRKLIQIAGRMSARITRFKECDTRYFRPHCYVLLDAPHRNYHKYIENWILRVTYLIRELKQVAERISARTLQKPEKHGAKTQYFGWNPYFLLDDADGNYRQSIENEILHLTQLSRGSTQIVERISARNTRIPCTLVKYLEWVWWRLVGIWVSNFL